MNKTFRIIKLTLFQKFNISRNFETTPIPKSELSSQTMINEKNESK